MSVMIEIVNANDARAVRNKENVLALYDAMINKKNPEEAVSQFLEPSYIQHNPLVPDTAAGLAGVFGQMKRGRRDVRVCVSPTLAGEAQRWGDVKLLKPFK